MRRFGGGIAVILAQEAAMKTASVLAASLCIAFAGCTLKGPELRVKPPVEVKVEGNDVLVNI